jgi:pimeloyl-ACP methyl ester carboxylesterase
MTRRSLRFQSGALVALCVASLVLGACASPVRAIRADRTDAHRELTRSVVTTGDLSWSTRDVLLERGLFAPYADAPEAVVAELHREMVAEGGDPTLLYALAEASYLHGEEADVREYQLAAAVYAYAFLFPEDAGASRPDALDPRLRNAADLYNWAVTAAFASEDGSEMVPRGGHFELPFGGIDIAFDPAELRAGSREMVELTPAAELEVRGLAARYRRPGIGASLAASTRPLADAVATDMVAPKLRVPVTALLRVKDARKSLVEGLPLSATLELHAAWDDDSVEIGGETVLLESEPTAALALTFTGIPIIEIEMLGFLGRLTGLAAERPPLVSTTPYRPGLIPVIFVHGTASSVVRWAELYNRLSADPELQRRYQFWFFQYDSDNPIALSSLALRDAITAAVERLDPEGDDDALRRMVLIGHSQGGLLVRMQSIHTEDRLWNAISRKPFEELRLTDENRELLRRGFFIDPVPNVSRVIFIATPHRGSFLAASSLVTGLLRRLTQLPGTISRLGLDVARNLDAARTPFVPTAVDNMSPRHPFILGLQQIPVAESIRAHSIIAVDGTIPVEEGNDGVVEYTSAHIEGVESERVVDSPHSCQGHPDTMEEVRRILRLHAAETSGDSAGDPR